MAKHLTYSKGIIYTPTLLNAITEDTTSSAQLVAGAKGIGIEFTEGGTVNNRSGVLTITVSMDGGTSFRAYNMLIDNLSNAITEGLTRVDSKTRNSAGTDILWMTPETLGGITHIKASIDVTDGASPTGNFTVKAIITY